MKKTNIIADLNKKSQKIRKIVEKKIALKKNTLA